MRKLLNGVVAGVPRRWSRHSGSLDALTGGIVEVCDAVVYSGGPETTRTKNLGSVGGDDRVTTTV